MIGDAKTPPVTVTVAVLCMYSLRERFYTRPSTGAKMIHVAKVGDVVDEFNLVMSQAIKAGEFWPKLIDGVRLTSYLPQTLSPTF